MPGILLLSQLLSTGMISKDWIAQQMGHTSTKMLDDHYAKWIPEDAKKPRGLSRGSSAEYVMAVRMRSGLLIATLGSNPGEVLATGM